MALFNYLQNTKNQQVQQDFTNRQHLTYHNNGSKFIFKTIFKQHLQQGDFETTPPNNIVSQTIFVANTCNQKTPTQ
jgi:hypothetical protein